MTDLLRVENGNIVADSRMIAEHFGKEHAHVMRDIRDEMDKLYRAGEGGLSIFGESSYVNAQNKTQPCFTMGEEGLMQIAARYDAVARRRLIVRVKELKEQVRALTAKTELKNQLILQMWEGGVAGVAAAKQLVDMEVKEATQPLLETIAVQTPKVEYFDELVERNLLTNIRDTAKELKVKQTRFTAWLLARRYVYRDIRGKLKPYSQYVGTLFEMKEFTREDYSDVQTLITPKGRETFRLLIKEDLE